MYKVILPKKVKKEVNKIPANIRKKILISTKVLSQNPISGTNIIKLSGSEDNYRLRVGRYRVIYGVEKSKKEVVIKAIKHRKDAYQRNYILIFLNSIFRLL